MIALCSKTMSHKLWDQNRLMSPATKVTLYHSIKVGDTTSRTHSENNNDAESWFFYFKTIMLIVTLRYRSPKEPLVQLFFLMGLS